MSEKISVIIPSYNHNHFLIRAVESALSLDGEKDIIIIDDGSSTPVKNIWGEPVTVLRHTQNRGLSAALNTGIRFSKTKRFVICAADDQLHKLYISKMTSFKADIVSCDMFAGRRVVRSIPGSLERLKLGNCHSYAALIKKAVWELIGGFKESMNPSWEDYEFFLNAAEHEATWDHVSLPLHIYNRNPVGRDADAQGKDSLLKGKLEGFHPQVFGEGRGLVTFVIPCYKQEDFLEDAINSCLNQIYPHIRVVVVDDASPNGKKAKQIVDSYGDKVHYIRHKENQHLSATRNTGIRYAIDVLKSQYFIPLDADDEVDPKFVEEALSIIEDRKYIYSDVQFIGSASHVLTLNPYDCKVIVKKHVHPCTILMSSEHYQEVVNRRGYGYDEGMKDGYEDWEFALACLQAGICGKKVDGYLFRYRQHPNGSMRTEAQKINTELARVVKNKHPWIRNERNVEMGCKTCGGGKSLGRITIQKGGYQMLVNVPGVGEVDSRTAIQVTYTGNRTDTVTKVGRGIPGSGVPVYKYSAKNPVFTIAALDANLFPGPFQFVRVDQAIKDELQVEFAQQDPMLNKSEVTPTIEIDDLGSLKYVGDKALENFSAAGITSFQQVADLSDGELKDIVGPRFKNVKEQIIEKLK